VLLSKHVYVSLYSAGISKNTQIHIHTRMHARAHTPCT